MKLVTPSRFSKLGSLLVFLPAVASAHPGHDGGHGLEWDFAGGFTHPLFGLDHLLAMLAVGVWAAQLGGRARWLIPATFLSVMAIGAIFGNQGVANPAAEQMIAASLLVLGLLVALAKRLPVSAGLAITAFFAAFHGFAHGAELPASSGGLSFGLGFLAATLLLHGAGMALAGFSHAHQSWISKAVGAVIAVVGGVLLVA